ncbi:hypothetical protein F4604DRAFT_1153388 [Suillus subluteus]|nr:hypothetical protein F4604DRAFT_1153388 [Suillus subluteus]
MIPIWRVLPPFLLTPFLETALQSMFLFLSGSSTKFLYGSASQPFVLDSNTRHHFKLSALLQSTYSVSTRLGSPHSVGCMVVDNKVLSQLVDVSVFCLTPFWPSKHVCPPSRPQCSTCPQAHVTRLLPSRLTPAEMGHSSLKSLASA